jgi:hypothetical protein
LAGQRIVEPQRHKFPLCLLWPGASKSNFWIEDATAPARGKARRYKIVIVMRVRRAPVKRIIW